VTATHIEPGPLTRRAAHAGRGGTIAVALTTLGAAALVDVLIRHESGLSGDEPFYERIATDPGAPHNFPYAYRVAVPWLVHILPFSHVVSFTGLALIAIAAASAAMYALLGEFGIEPLLSGALALGFALSPTLLVVLVRHGRSVDPASVLVLTLGCLLIVRRKRVALALTLLVGAAVRESTLFLIPLAYVVWAERPFDWEALRDVVLVTAAPVAVYVILRTSINAVGRQYQPGYTGPFLKARWDIVRSALSGATLPVELRRLAYTFGPLWLVAPFALRDLSFARRGLVLVVLCLASLTFAYDWGRIMFLAAPVFFVAAACVVDDRRRLALATVLVLLAVDIGYGVYLQAYGVKHGLDTTVTRHIPVY
jgi:hypothetical protein